MCFKEGLRTWHSGKEPACQRTRHRRRRFQPWVGKIPRRRAWQPTPVFSPENPVDRGAWWATVRGVRKSQTGQHTQISQLGLCYSSSAGVKLPHGVVVVKAGLPLPWYTMLFSPRTVLFLQLQHTIPLTPPQFKCCDYHSVEHQKENGNLSKLPQYVPFRKLEGKFLSRASSPHGVHSCCYYC